MSQIRTCSLIAAVLGCCALFPANAYARQQPAASKMLSVVITDDAGKPLPGAEAYLVDATYGLPLSLAWSKADAAGAASFRLADLDASLLENGKGAVILIAHAPKHAWSTQKVNLPADAAPARLTLAQGKPVEIALTAPDGATLPSDLLPVVFAEGQSVAAWLTWVQGQHRDRGAAALFNAAVPEKLEGGRWRVNIPADCANLWVLVNHAGFLRCFQAGPFDSAALAKGRIDITLPKPATLAIKIAPEANKPHEYTSCGFSIGCTPPIPDGGWSFTAQEQFADAQALDVKLSDLAPLTYNVTAFTGSKQTYHDRKRAEYFQTQQGAEVAAGASHDFNFALQTWDEHWWREHLKGDHQLTVKVTRPDGSPAAGKTFSISFTLQQFGRELALKQGEIPASGEVTVDNLPAGGEAWLAVKVADNDVGTVFIDRKEQHAHAEFSIPPEVGELAPDIALTRLDNGQTFTLSSLRGKVVLLDFWASWCGPCQEPMMHNNTLLGTRSDWQGKVAMVGASIDDKIETIQDHVNKRQWTAVLQSFCGEGEPGWRCKAAKTYAVTAVPTAFLINRDGRITWTGHPASIDVEKEIDKLLNQ